MLKIDERTDRWRRTEPRALTGVVLTGPGAADAARGMVVDALVRDEDHIEVVLDQADAEYLLEAGPEAEDRFPYLVITAGPAQTLAYLRTPGPRRLVVTTGDGAEFTGADQAMVVALAAGPLEAAEIAADGRVATRSCGLDLPDRLPTLTLLEANARLMSDG